jgi:hypothetical protein
MLSERLTDPHIFAVVCANKQYEVVTGGIVGVEEIRDYAQQTEAPCEEDELIFFT